MSVLSWLAPALLSGIGIVGLVRASPLGSPHAVSGLGGARGSPAPALSSLGATIRARARDPALLRQIEDRTLALIAIAAGPLMLVRWWLGPVVVLASIGVARHSATAQHKARERRLVVAVPVLLDIVRAGLATGASVRAILLALDAEPTPPIALRPLGPALGEVAGRVHLGVPFADAIEPLARAAPVLRPFVATVRSSEGLGLPIGPALEVMSLDARQARRRLAEAHARRLPVLLLFPLVACTLPAFAALTVVPLLLSGFSSLQP